MLPVDPFDQLKAQIGKIDAYKEEWEVRPAVARVIRGAFGKSGVVKTRRVWYEEKDGSVDFPNLPHRVMSPVLTCSAQHATPQIGKSTTANIGGATDTISTHLRSLAINIVPMESMDEPKPLNRDAVLDLKPTIDAETQSGIRTLLEKCGLGSKRSVSASESIPSAALSFLRSDSPIPEVSFEPMSPPIFARVRREDVKDQGPDLGMQNLGDLAEAIPELKLDEGDLQTDFIRENLVVVNGWSALVSSQTELDTPALSSGSSEVDELEDDDMWLPSSPGKLPPVVASLMDAKLDDHIISRSERIDGAHLRGASKGGPIVEGQSLHSFLTPLILPEAVRSVEKIPELSSLPTRIPSLAPSLSMLGQPPSEADEAPLKSVAGDDDGSHSDNDIGASLKTLYKPLNGENPKKFVMQERLDGKDGVLMDVLSMCPPNIHEPDETLPKSMSSLVPQIQTHELHGGVTADVKSSGSVLPASLKKVVGIKSLNLELSWRPFNFGRKVPTHEQISDVSFSLTDVVSIDDTDRRRFEGLLATADSSDLPSDSNYMKEDLTDVPNLLKAEANDVQIILTRAERRRLAGYVEESHDAEEEFAPEESTNLVEASPESQRPSKRPRTDSAALTLVNDHEKAFEPDLRDLNGISQDLVVEDFVSAYEPEDFEPSNDVLYYIPAPDPTFDNGNFLEESTLASASVGGYRVDSAANAKTTNFEPFVGKQAPLGLNYRNFQDDVGGLMGVEHATSKNASKQARHTPTPDNRRFLNSWLEAKGVAPTEGPIAPIPSAIIHDTMLSDCTDISAEPSPIHAPPEVLADRHTLTLPDAWDYPRNPNCYMASLDLIQKRALVRCLYSELCAVELVERDHLCGVDIIVNPSSAIVFRSLAALPSQCDEFLKQLSSLSWSYSCILIIFEAFPASMMYRSCKPGLMPSAYTPPVLKVLKRLRRDLGLHEGLGNKCAECLIQFAFAESVEDAAMFARMFGSRSPLGLSWDASRWMGSDEQEGEAELATMPGMNPFASSVMLRRCRWDELVDMPSEVRRMVFGPLVGRRMIDGFNCVLNQRLASINMCSDG
ncbi:hypothetical protein BD410DRAFT_829345 [Rickenella mellea]|uniref:Uncharacterized protein n=1 Tax=Rickenella mellea TaxID=50990 RepID=A0A4Y7Q0S8_9AGAM|nr:hypothetical protein BD410DRAFT_829345 [Rickenella mellea]